MAFHASFRLLTTGGVAAIIAAPLVIAFAGPHASTPLAECPPGQVVNALTGICGPLDDIEAPANPLNPAGVPLQPGAITSAEPGQIGQLPEINGIPCNGGNTGLCIALSEQNP